MKIYPFLVLVRPANVVTAISDILAGVALSGVLSTAFDRLPFNHLLLLCLSTSTLYAGGIVFNDVFDFETDKIERPERPLPSGEVSLQSASLFGIALLTIGLIAAALVSVISFYIAIGIIISALSYDKFFKHNLITGPIVMGTCRGLNLLLGMSLLGENLPTLWFISFIPLVFIAAITLTSQGEVLGNNKLSITIALILDLAIFVAILFLGWKGLLDFWTVLPFALIWFGMNAYAKSRAISINTSEYIMNAVKIGVISLIPLNASYAAGSSNWVGGIVVLTLLPLSLFLSKKFAVT